LLPIASTSTFLQAGQKATGLSCSLDCNWEGAAHSCAGALGRRCPEATARAKVRSHASQGTGATRRGARASCTRTTMPAPAGDAQELPQPCHAHFNEPLTEGIKF